MSKPMKVELSIPCLSEFVGIVRLTVSGIATRMNFSIEEIEDIKIAVSEACTNAVQYAYDNVLDNRIFISCILEDNRLEIIIEDKGKGFDVAAIEGSKPLEIVPDKLGLGLGLTFIKSLMDEAYIDSIIGKGTIVRMVKFTTAKNN